MDWGKVKSMVSKVAPVLGNAIVPGIGGLAGSLVAESLGVENEPEAVETALVSASPETLARLKEIQLHHKERLIELGVEQDRVVLEREKALLADTRDARGLQKASLQQDDKFAKRFIYYYAAIVTAVSFIYFFMVTFGTVPDANKHFADIILGFMLGTLIGTIIVYFYGSSTGSVKKNETMERILSWRQGK